MGKKKEVEQSEQFKLARAIAVANGHSHPDYYAECVEAAYLGNELPRNPTDDPLEDIKDEKDGGGEQEEQGD